MSSQVSVQSTRLRKTLITLWTSERLFTSMRSHVNLKVRVAGENFGTDWTLNSIDPESVDGSLKIR